ncbi:MAG: hypothetical protein GY804_09990 [Alphaproteobacteria bacterium]|nr:hypothetical protein [Alphaproteobacteria bacterium]
MDIKEQLNQQIERVLDIYFSHRMEGLMEEMRRLERIKTEIDRSDSESDVEAMVMQKFAEVTDAYDTYIKLLDKEIEGLIDIARAHGWDSQLYQEGVICRRKIKEAIGKVGNDKQTYTRQVER